MKRSIRDGALFTVFFLTAIRLAAAETPKILELLSAEEQAELATGKMIQQTFPVEGKVWPKVKIFYKASATPLEVGAVFNAHEAQPSFIPDMLTCRVLSVLDGHVLHIETLINLPWPVPNERVVTKNTLQSDPERGSFQFRWDLLEADTTEHSEGQILIEPLSQYETLIMYENFVVPGSALASHFENQAIESVQKSNRAFRDRIRDLKESKPDELLKESESFIKFLAKE